MSFWPTKPRCYSGPWTRLISWFPFGYWRWYEVAEYYWDKEIGCNMPLGTKHVVIEYSLTSP
jgi:hypothetical protein